jgi:uncharacterized protein DUF4149
MQRFLAISGHWIHALAFAVWLGGIFTLGAIVAPAAFGVSRPFAGQVMTHSFRTLNTLSFVCGAVMLAATWAEWRERGEPARRLLFVRAVLTAAALALALFLALRLLPSMLGLRSAGQMAEFDRLHQFSAMIFQVQTFLLLAAAAISAFLAFPRRAPEPRITDTTPGAAPPPADPNARTPERPNAGAQRP